MRKLRMRFEFLKWARATILLNLLVRRPSKSRCAWHWKKRDFLRQAANDEITSGRAISTAQCSVNAQKCTAFLRLFGCWRRQMRRLLSKGKREREKSWLRERFTIRALAK